MTPADITNLITLGEGFTTEFKRSGADKSLGREICAFANASGGTILIGVTDADEIVGVDDHNRLKSQIQSFARSAEPPIMVEIESIDNLLCVTIPEQHEKPYSFGGKFFMREGPSSQQMSREQIREFFFKEGLIHFDETYCPDYKLPDDLTDDIWARFVGRAKIPVDMDRENTLRNLHLVKDGKMTHAGAWLLCNDITFYTLTAGVTCVMFRGTTNSRILDRRDFSGDLYSIYESCMAYMQSKLNTALIPHARGRDERLELPEDALREALVNAIVHRNYRATTNVQVRIYYDRLEIVTPGGLPAGMRTEDLGYKSVARNSLLFSLFFRMNLVEKIGSGVKRIRDLCREYGASEPVFDVSEDWVTVIFPRETMQLTQRTNELGVANPNIPTPASVGWAKAPEVLTEGAVPIETEDDGNDPSGNQAPPLAPGDIPPNGPESRGIYGRGREIDKLAVQLAQTPILLVHGIAGVGKSLLIEEIRHAFNRAEPGGMEYKSVTIRATEHLSPDEIFERLAPTLGCFDDEPKAPRQLGRLDLKRLAKYAAAEPAIVHIYRAHAAFTESGFVNSEVPTFLRGLVKYLPQFRVILESTKRAPEGLFREDEYHRHRVRGLDGAAVTAFFRRPFPKRPQIGWALAEEETHAIYDRLGGRNKNDGAHPLGLIPLAVVAEGLKCNPYQALQRHPVVLREKLEEELFQDLYENVLTPPQRHLLRLAALYRQPIPVAHEEALNRRAAKEEDTIEGAFQALVQRFLLSPDEREERFELHILFAELTRARIVAGDFDYQLDHGVIAEGWLATVRGIRTRRLPYILAANEAAHHLLEAEEFHRLDELSVTLLGRDTPAQLERWSDRLHERGDREKRRPVLELLTKLLPDEHKYHRFLGETIEKLEGRGVDEALAHYLKAHELDTTYPQNLANLGRCYLARGEPEQFVARVAGLSPLARERAVDAFVQDIHANCLERVGRGEEASALRQERIGQGARNPALYNDEAVYLQKCQRFEEALGVLEKAEEAGVLDDHSWAIRAGILQQMGRGEEASAIRRDRIAAGIRNPIFYNDEALYRWEKLNDPTDALAVLKEAQRAGAADDHGVSIRGRVLEALDRGQEASKLRQGRIAAGTRNAALYNDEALYLKKQGDLDRALAMLEQARARGCEDEHTRTLRPSIERQRESAGQG
uniref:Predicted transcriptional regulator, contains HTH domain n=1 Tax=Candidatus Kentrum sp. DK TaxID=2126562 RepID=A0A450STM5_9GAMM|nr:MAG: Predicted transcriptional regulator, contains HTH domain [Candidatus Kentron sp. DK]